jgi:CheY-like chemotaxis protein
MAKILVIDDDKFFREMLCDMLHRAGYTVTSAEDGQSGIENCRREPVDLVVTDILMPVKDGVTTIQELQKEFPGVKIIAVSGGGAVNKGEAYLQATKYITGVRHIFTKPFAKSDFIQAVKELVG